MTSRICGGIFVLLMLGASAPTSLGAPAAKGLMVEGRGVATFQATFVRGTSNIAGTPFTSIGRLVPKSARSRRRIVSSSNAQLANGFSVVINFIKGRNQGDQGPPRSEREIKRDPVESSADRDERLRLPSAFFNVTFASPGGFRAGQVIPVIKPAYSEKPRPANAILSYDDVVRIEGRDVFDGNGQRIRTGRTVVRTWVGVSGQVRIQSVTADKITYSIQNARFTAPVTAGMMRGQNSNEGRGSFVLNGIGQSTFNEVD